MKVHGDGRESVTEERVTIESESTEIKFRR